MPDRAKVTSLDALQSFRASLVIYLEKAGRVLDEINDDVLRMKLWLQTNCRTACEKEIRRRARDLAERKQELFSAKLSSFQTATQTQQMAVQKAKRALTEVEDRLARIKQWNNQYDNRVGPQAKEVDKLREVLADQMRHAVLYLAQVEKTLAAYAERSQPTTPTSLQESAESEVAVGASNASTGGS